MKEGKNRKEKIKTKKERKKEAKHNNEIKCTKGTFLNK